jgi:excisionase family DNA binding protein
LERMAYTVDEARVQLGGVSKHLIYEWLNSKALGSVKIGRRRFITHEQITTFLNQHTVVDA